MGEIIEKGLGAFKYALAVFMMYAGVATCIAPLTPASGSLGFLYSTRISLVIFGIIFFISGFMLFYGKVTKSRYWTGKGLLAIYLCFVFATVLNFIATTGTAGFWMPNAIAAIITGALWLRWKFKTEYINPHHFREDIRKLK